MFNILQKFKRNRIWNVAVYVEKLDFSFQNKIHSPVTVFNSKKLRKGRKHLHTYADPFLFSQNSELFLFFESQTAFEKGKIEAVKTSDLVNFEYVGEILKEAWHLSYPFVFESDSSIFLIPESLEKNEICLYEFEEFPHKPKKVRVLLEGQYKDSSLIKHNGKWFLFTSSERGFEIFFTDNIRHGKLTAHPMNPITTSPKYSRCGGGPIMVNCEMYRISQDSSAEYGKNISALRINKLSGTEYDEEIIVDDYFALDETWNSRGGHHFSLTEFKDKQVIAVDGKQNDFFVNKFLSLLY